MAGNPARTREELILALDLYALDLYFRCPPSRISKRHPEIVALSRLLSKLPRHGVIPDPTCFRNPNAVYMKLCNFLRLDPSYHGAGLRAGSKLDAEVWEEFSGDCERLRAIAEAIKQCVLESPYTILSPEYCENEEFREGAVLFRIHRDRERNATLIRRRKEAALRQDGTLRCEVCGFDFSRVYGPLGKGYVECHHTTPVSQLRPRQTTKLADLALVCSNCHRILHRGGSTLTVEALREVVRTRCRRSPASSSPIAQEPCR